MIKAKRYHPVTMLFDLWTFVKNSIIIVIYLFVINLNSQSMFIKYGRIVFYFAIVFTLASIYFKWLTKRYELDESAFHLYKGVFSKSERTIPFSKIQNVNRHTSLLHRIFKVTSIHFETGMAGEDATITFEVISKKEADEIEKYVASRGRDEVEVNESLDEINNRADEQVVIPTTDKKRTIHFTPTTWDVFKASFTSLSFFLLIPVVASIYFKIDDIFHVEEAAEGIFARIVSSWWLITLLLTVLIIASVIFGVVRTFLKYGKYEISSDSDRIYISKGIIDETAFSIAKDRVQAIEINQSVMKRILGLAEVKLISAGNLEIDDDKLEVSVLYPFLPVKRAYEMVTEILPSYEVTLEMNRLPRKSFWVRFFQPSWLWLVGTIGLFYFKPSIGNIDQAWWIISVMLLLIIIASRVLDYLNTRYAINKEFIQFKTGSLTTSLFLSKREKVIEVSVSRSVFQKMFGLASIGTINRAQPVYHTGVEDIPIELAQSFYAWYVERKNEVQFDKG